MMAEFVSIPTQRLKARQFVHPDDDSEVTVKTYSSVEVAAVFGRNRPFFVSDEENQKSKRYDSRKQLLRYEMENSPAIKDPKEEQEMNDWLENLQLKSQSTSSVLQTTTAAKASIVTAAAFRLKSKIKNKHGNGNTLTKSLSTPIITINEVLTEPQVADEQEANQSKTKDYLHAEPLIPITDITVPLKTTMIETSEKSSTNRSKKLLEVEIENQQGIQHSAEECGNGATPSSSSPVFNQPSLQVKTVGSKIRKSKKSTKC